MSQIDREVIAHQPIKESLKRAPNFTEREKAVFTDIMFNFKDVIENKKTDNITVKQNKKLAWKKLQDEFNCQVIPITARILTRLIK